MTHPHRPELPLSRRHLLALAGAGTLSACGGGGDTTTAEGPTAHPLGVATGGTGHRPMAFLSANITAIRPLGVGGVILDTQGASLLDGSNQALHEATLKLGMTARVLAGAIVGGKAMAYSVQVDTQVVGDASWQDSNNLLVLGQRVHLTPATTRGPGATGTPGAVRVWGQLDLAQGRIVASRLERGIAGESTMLRGVLTRLDRVQALVQVGSLVASAADPAMLPAELVPGAIVRAALGAAGPDGVRQLVQLRDDTVRPPDGLAVALQGRITHLTSTRAFAVDGLAVDASIAKIEGIAQLQPGAEAHVEGRMQGGVLVARSVAIEAAEPLEVSGRVLTVDLAAQTFTLPGWTVKWNAATLFAKGLPAGLRAGRKLAVIGRWVPGATALQALRVSLN